MKGISETHIPGRRNNTSPWNRTAGVGTLPNPWTDWRLFFRWTVISPRLWSPPFTKTGLWSVIMYGYKFEVFKHWSECFNFRVYTEWWLVPKIFLMMCRDWILLHNILKLYVVTHYIMWGLYVVTHYIIWGLYVVIHSIMWGLYVVTHYISVEFLCCYTL